MRGRVERHAETAGDLEADDDGGQKIFARGVHQFGRSEGGRHHRGAGMQRGIGMGIVEIERMAERAVEQGRRHRAITPVHAEDGAGAFAIQPHGPQHRQHSRRRFPFRRRPDDGTDKVAGQRQRPARRCARNARRRGIDREAGKHGCNGHGVGLGFHAASPFCGLICGTRARICRARSRTGASIIAPSNMKAPFCGAA